MNTLLFPALLLCAGAVAAWGSRSKPRLATLCGAATACGGGAAGLTMLIMAFCAGNNFSIHELFAIPVLILTIAAAIHSIGYLDGHGSERSGSYWFLLNLTASSMIFVVMAESRLGFLFSWEIMGAASSGLVLFDRHNRRSSYATWIYMMACHAGAALLILLFFFPHTPVWVFILALAGFGLKIGLPLLHVWLPEAHPAAPAPVSALMSGAMIELGIFGVLCFGTVSQNHFMLYGWVLTVAGIITAPLGIIFAIAQSNLKKLLAYSSIENMGILCCAAGLGFLGAAYDIPEMMFCGFAGGALHLLNHALLKGGLFLAAGSVYKAAGTLDMDEMGGLLQKMPFTGTAFILHAFSLCGLPPFAGFAGEFLIYMAAFAGLSTLNTPLTALAVTVLVLLALTGGLAAAAFAKAIGGVFCGAPRSAKAADAAEVPFFMNMPIMLLWVLSWLLLFVFPFLFFSVCSVKFPDSCLDIIIPLCINLAIVALISFALTVLAGLLLIVRRLLIARAGERVSLTWDCGYAAPDAKMEYTATSFSQNPADFFRSILRPLRRISKPCGIFPNHAEFEEEIPDGGIRSFWQYIFNAAGKLADRIHVLQSGYLHFYLLVMVLTIAGMLLCAVLGGN